MGLTSASGRILFAAFFLFSAWHQFHEFGVDGGPAAEIFRSKFDLFSGYMNTQHGFQVPEIDMKYAVAAAIALKALGGTAFIFGCSAGAYLLLLYLFLSIPSLFELYEHNLETPEFHQLLVEVIEKLTLVGALLFFIGMSNCIPKRQQRTKKSSPKHKAQ